MNNRYIIKFSIFAAALILVGLVGYAVVRSGEAFASSALGPVGSWIVSVEIPDRTIVDVGSFHSDGTMTVMENSAAGVGLWEKISSDSYAFTMWILIDTDMSPDGFVCRGKVVSTIQLSQDGEQYSGPSLVTLYTPEGEVIGEHIGLATGQRMHVELMP